MSTADRTPDEIIGVEVEGGRVYAYVYGSGDRCILCLAGGPAARSNYLQLTHAYLAGEGYKVVFLDALGAGRSDRPDNPALWTMERYAREVETVRTALGLGRCQLYGHSFGAMLGLEYAIRFPGSISSLVVSHGMADMPFHQQQVDRLVAALGPEFLRMRRAHEINGTTDSPEYMASETLLWYRHVCRLPYWPEEMLAQQKDMYLQPYQTMVGPGEYRCTGTLKEWSVLGQLHTIRVPALVLTGEHDALTPDESLLIAERLPHARMHLFRNASHVPFWETPGDYRSVLEPFLAEHAR